jgi:hypothetical protein
MMMLMLMMIAIVMVVVVMIMSMLVMVMVVAAVIVPVSMSVTRHCSPLIEHPRAHEHNAKPGYDSQCLRDLLGHDIAEKEQCRQTKRKDSDRVRECDHRTQKSSVP